MVPRRDWYTIQPPSLMYGPGHSARVMVWTTVLAGEGPLFEPALWAAACHDLCRINDGLDPEHGARAAAWVREQLPRHIEEPPDELDSIARACQWHCHADADVGWKNELVWLLKDADGLDRVRFGDLDVRMLRSDKARAQVDAAEQLFRRTRKLREPVDVWSEAFRMGLSIDRLLDFDFGLKSQEEEAAE